MLEAAFTDNQTAERRELKLGAALVSLASGEKPKERHKLKEKKIRFHQKGPFTLKKKLFFYQKGGGWRLGGAGNP